MCSQTLSRFTDSRFGEVSRKVCSGCQDKVVDLRRLFLLHCPFEPRILDVESSLGMFSAPDVACQSRVGPGLFSRPSPSRPTWRSRGCSSNNVMILQHSILYMDGEVDRRLVRVARPPLHQSPEPRVGWCRCSVLMRLVLGGPNVDNHVDRE